MPLDPLDAGGKVVAWKEPSVLNRVRHHRSLLHVLTPVCGAFGKRVGLGPYKDHPTIGLARL